MHTLFIGSISVNAKQSICVHIQSVGACEGPFLQTASTFSVKFIIVPSINGMQLFVTSWAACSTRDFPVFHCLPEFAQFMSVKLMKPSNHLILCHPLLLLPSIFPSIRIFSSESVLRIKWPKYWSFSFSICLSNEYSGLISLRINQFVLLVAQGTLKSLLLHHNLKSSAFGCSTFFMVQLSYPYMTTGKTVSLTRCTIVSKLMSLLLNMLSRFVIAFLSRSERLLISWLQSLSIVILEPKKVKSVTVSIVSPSICHEVMGLDP